MVSNIEDTVILYKGGTIEMYKLFGAQKYNMSEFEIIQSVLKDARQTIIDTYEDQLIQAFKHKNQVFRFKI